jgi:RNA polymerase sigma-70 factor (ECF subfamily)
MLTSECRVGMDPVDHALDQVFREDGARLLAALISRYRDFELAEDALQDALTVAADRWRRDGLPANPAGWLMAVAKNKAVDRLRRDQSLSRLFTQAEPNTVSPPADFDPPPEDHIPDERLKLVFTCCHPALSTEAQVALTLKAVAGLSTEEIARAFLVSGPTMAQRLVRAKRKIREAGIPFDVPSADRVRERTETVTAVLYLIFNEGYGALSGDQLVRAELCDEAIRLGRLLVELLERAAFADEMAEALGLLALMLLHDAMRSARISPQGELVTLDQQDRSAWDWEKAQEGLRVLERASQAGAVGPYQIQAAVSAVHIKARSAHETDWREIVALYDVLQSIHPSPVVTLNRAIAVSMVEGPRRGLDLTGGLADALADYVPYHAARADLLRRSGELEEACHAYDMAIQHADNVVERAYFERRRGELQEKIESSNRLNQTGPGRV